MADSPELDIMAPALGAAEAFFMKDVEGVCLLVAYRGLRA